MNNRIVPGGYNLFSWCFSVHFRHGSTKNFYIFTFYPGIILFYPTLVQIRQNFQFTCVENEKSGSVLLCFLGVALLKIVYKKANQRADFYFSSNTYEISVQSNDMVLNKSRAIAGQRGLSLLYQQ